MKISSVSMINFGAMSAKWRKGSLVTAEATGKIAEQLGCEKGVKKARFLIDKTKIKTGESIPQAINRGITAMKTAEAQGRYKDISNEVL